MTKVTHTETHDNTLVCKGKLVLLNNKDGVSFHDSYSGNMIIGRESDDLPLLHIKPIIVSETEDVEIGDKFYSPDGGIFICNKVDQYYIEAMDSRSRSGTTASNHHLPQG